MFQLPSLCICLEPLPLTLLLPRTLLPGALPPHPSTRPQPQEIQAAAAEATAGLVPLDALEESETRCAQLENRLEGLETERDVLQDKVGTGHMAAR